MNNIIIMRMNKKIIFLGLFYLLVCTRKSITFIEIIITMGWDEMRWETWSKVLNSYLNFIARSCSSGRGDSNYSSILQEDMNCNNKLNYGQETGLDSSQIQKDFSPESQDSTLINPFTPGNIVTSSGNCTPTSSSSYGYSSSLLQNLLGSDHMNQPQPQQSLSNAHYGANSSKFSPLSSSWSPKISPFFKPSLPKLQFSNNTAFWNASAAAPSLPSFLPQSQSHVLEDKSIATKV